MLPLLGIALTELALSMSLPGPESNGEQYGVERPDHGNDNSPWDTADLGSRQPVLAWHERSDSKDPRNEEYTE